MAFVLYNLIEIIYMLLKLIGILDPLDLYTLVVSSYDICFSMLVLMMIFYYLASINALFKSH